MLKLQFVDYRQAPVWVIERSFSIGRDLTNQLCIDSPCITNIHAKILQNGRSFVLKDMGSAEGTFVNNQRITHKNIACGDILRLGDTELRVLNPFEDKKGAYWSLIADSSWLSGKEFHLPFSKEKKCVSIGRSASCDLTIAGTHLSKNHAEIVLPEHLDKKNTALILKDLGSTNGTFVNGKKIKTTHIKAGDQLRFDVCSFRVFGPGIKLPSATSIKAQVNENDSVFLEETQTAKKKTWKTRPTSPGNRLTNQKQQRSWFNIIVTTLLLATLFAFSIYLGWALM